MPSFREVAIAIGYHFWQVDTDEKAYECGKDAARDVMRRLEKAGA